MPERAAPDRSEARLSSHPHSAGLHSRDAAGFWKAMRPLLIIPLLSLAAAALTPEQVAMLPPPAAREVDFAKDIAPLFDTTCVKCHGKGKAKAQIDN